LTGKALSPPGAAEVAIIVPCYNAAETIGATLESALAQDMAVDVIVVDDGSKDRSILAARHYEPQVRVLTGPNRGASAARNTGIAHSNADWIVFLDADDVLEPGTLAKRLAQARETQADVVICDWLDVQDDGTGRLATIAHRSIDWPALEADAELAIAGHVWATTAAILYSRAIVDKIGGFRADLPVIQDARFLFDAAHHHARFTRSDHVGARYRIVQGSLSRRNPGHFWADVLLSGCQIETLWRARGSLAAGQIDTLAGIYNNAARGLFCAQHPAYLQAVACYRRLGLPLPLHSRIAAPLASLLGQRAAQKLLSIVGRNS
jgi:Glycosyl transferase family 2